MNEQARGPPALSKRFKCAVEGDEESGSEQQPDHEQKHFDPGGTDSAKNARH
jgi:hypothetical protein